MNPLRDLKDSDKEDAPKASWLLVFDGVEDPSVLDEFWPYNGPGSVLITSRSPFSWTASIRLNPFTTEGAVQFLLKLTRREASEEQQQAVGDVSEHLGRLPLALAQIAGLIQHKDLSFAEFLESYNEQQELLRQSNSDLVADSTGYEHTLASVWALDNLAHGVPLLNMISMLDPDSIPEWVLTEPLTKAHLGIFPQSWPEFLEARKELLACSLISRYSIEKTLSVHRLVQDVIRARMTPDEFRDNFMACVKLTVSI